MFQNCNCITLAALVCNYSRHEGSLIILLLWQQLKTCDTCIGYERFQKLNVQVHYIRFETQKFKTIIHRIKYLSIVGKSLQYKELINSHLKRMNGSDVVERNRNG